MLLSATAVVYRLARAPACGATTALGGRVALINLQGLRSGISHAGRSSAAGRPSSLTAGGCCFFTSCRENRLSRRSGRLSTAASGSTARTCGATSSTDGAKGSCPFGASKAVGPSKSTSAAGASSCGP